MRSPGLARVCVFCGSSPGSRPQITALAERLGTVMARRGLGLVYGGAQVGVMGRLADAALAAGGHVTGVIPEGLFTREVPHRGLSELRVVAGMHDRKAAMSELSDGFVVLPGGFGTLDELFEVTTWNQLGLHRPPKPVVLLDDDGFWDPLVTQVDTMVAAGFLDAAGRRLLGRAHDPDEALATLARAVSGAAPAP